MKSSRGSTLLQSALLLLAIAGLGYWAWQRYHRPPAPTFQGKTLDQWAKDLDEADYQVSDRAADVLVDVGAEAVPVLLDARERGDVRLHRRAVAALVRIGAPAVPGLVAALKDKPREQRIEVALVRLGAAAVPALREAVREDRGGEAAAHVLGVIGPPAREAVPDLIAVLQRQEVSLTFRSEAALALGHIGEPTAEIVAALVAALKDRKMDVRRHAAEALAWIGPPAHEAVPALIHALKDDEVKVAIQACQALAFLDEAAAAPALVQVLQSDRTELHPEAAGALWRLGPKAQAVLPSLVSLAQGPIEKTASMRQLLASFGPRIVPVLVKALHDDEAARRETAAAVLGRIGPPARPAVPDLITALKDKSPTVALTAAMALTYIDSTRAGPAVPLLADALDTPGAAQALANIGPDARSAVPALIAALKPGKKAGEADVIRNAAKVALAHIGKPAVPALIEALQDRREGVAPLAAEALAWIVPAPKETVPALREAIQKDRAHAAVYARALGQLGSLARAAVPELTELLEDNEVRPEAAVALVGIDPEQAKKVVPLLVKDLQATEEKRRQAAVLALAQLGPAAAPATEALTVSLQDRQLKGAELVALGAIGAEAVPSLVGLLKDPRVDFRRAALAGLIRIGPAAAAAVTPLIAALSDPERDIAAGAAQVLQGLGEKASPAVPALTANLTAYQVPVRLAAAIALGHIGPPAKEARRPLLECLFDPVADVRYNAALSLGRIDPTFTEAAPALREARHDPSPMVPLAAIDSLSHIEPAAIADSVPLLIALSSQPYPLDIRFRAVDGLSRFAPEQAKQAVPWLLIELTDENPGNCLYAGRLLAAIDSSHSADVMLALAAALRTPLAGARPDILRTLAEFGPKAREVTPEIERYLYDGTAGVRLEAMQALKAINPGRAKQLGGD